MENLIKIATEKYKGYFVNNQRVVWYYSNVPFKQTGIKLQTNDYFELEECLTKLRKNGLLLLQTNLLIVDVLELTKDSEIVYTNELNNEYIIIK